ncbi:hypothetical protein R8Z50_22570 [Longispora sp. K20-0274]
MLLPYVLAVPAGVYLLLRGGSRRADLAFGPFMVLGTTIAALT